MGSARLLTMIRVEAVNIVYENFVNGNFVKTGS